MEIVDGKIGDFRLVMETTLVGRAQIKLGKKDHVVEIPSQVCGSLYEPVPVPLGKGESITVYDSSGKIIIKS